MTNLIKTSLIASFCSVLIAGISIANALSIDVLPADSFRAVEAEVISTDANASFLSFRPEGVDNEGYLALYVGKNRPQMCADHRNLSPTHIKQKDGHFRLDLDSNKRISKALDSYSCIIVKNTIA